ncbi:rhomboid family intramembrane serine protease [Coprobacter tertius]|uniref:Rhomboid family intramembrane serine protease n=1 Tax=Coprobacter tertius TaxID=2944915 RepID=A0ABT1MJ84_9BACT|nr:rhomboid family intramembrane serine protease [Coprobacter tertius]MCP9612419.1 rhomboid family intramembrane serine protease [Coprobacter tertius]
MFQNKQGFFSSIPPVTKNLIIINFLFWLATIVLPKAGIDLVQYLGLHYFQAKSFNAIQLVTYMFMHDPGSIGHVFFNMFSVFMFGRTLEMVWGSKRFLIYYMITGIGAGLVQEVTWYFMLRDQIAHLTMVQGWETTQFLLNNIITIGASGAVFGILLAFGMLFPNSQIFLMFIPIPIKAKYFVIFYGVLELFLGVGNFSGDNVAHFAHLGGMLFGFFIIKYWRKKGFGNGSYF